MGEAKRRAQTAFERQAADERLGDQPIEAGFHAAMIEAVQALDLGFNGKVGGPGRKTGFVLLVFPFDDTGGRCNFASNGADRRDVLTLLKEMVARFEGQPEQSGRA